MSAPKNKTATGDPQKKPRKPRTRKPRDYGNLGFICLDEVCKRMGLPKQTILRLISTGKLKCVQFTARMWRVHEDWLAEFVQGIKDGTIKIESGK